MFNNNKNKIMADTTIDFEGNSQVQTNQATDNNPANQADKTSLDGGGTADITGKDNTSEGDTKPGDNKNGNQEGNKDNGNVEGNGDNSSSTGELEAGTQIEFDGITYTVAENGDVVDKDGKVFKEAKDVAKWLEENNTTDSTDSSEISIDSLRDAIGVDVTDENGNPVEFTNDAAGIKSYVDSVISLRLNEAAQGGVNKLFADNPLLKQFIDYVTINGTPKGFGDIPDRSGIQLDKDNPAQLEAIVRMAAKEFGNKSLNDTYIKYLKDSGALYDEAKNQLSALVGKDKAYHKEIEERAKAAREKEQQEIKEYWEGVNAAISKRIIGGYKLPDSFVKEVNGQKITLTPDDFYKYLSEPAVRDEDGNVLTAYQRDLNKLTNEEALNKELLDAWLTFTGGSYKNLIDMAVKEDNVRKLIVKSKQQRATRTIKINKPKQDKVDVNDILF